MSLFDPWAVALELAQLAAIAITGAMVLLVLRIARGNARALRRVESKLGTLPNGKAPEHDPAAPHEVLLDNTEPLS